MFHSTTRMFQVAILMLCSPIKMFQSAIAIRTMVVRPQGNNQHIVTVQAGASLVADSDPEKEYEETINKARGLLEAIRCLI